MVFWKQQILCRSDQQQLLHQLRQHPLFQISPCRDRSTITATYTTTCSKSATNTFPSSYSGNVVALLNSAGFVNSTRFGVASGKAVTVPAGSTTGTYYLTVAFPGSSVSITVYDVTPDANGNATQTRLNTYSSSFTPKSSGMYTTYRLGSCTSSLVG